MSKLFTGSEVGFVRAISRLIHDNPFLPARIESEREALGSEFVPGDTVWSSRPEVQKESPNHNRILEKVGDLVGKMRSRFRNGTAVEADDWALYSDLALYQLYYRYVESVTLLIDDPEATDLPVKAYREYRRQFDELFAVPGAPPGGTLDPAHFFACVFQIRRAFHHIFRHIIGGSLPAARLRAEVWQSIFTHDMHRYRRSLYERMGDVTTLITGGSGTGKELVARAIGLSRYIPFDPNREVFIESYAHSYQALNLSALSPTLIESELFGHRRGAFTGAVQDRPGWLEQCPPRGTVFLDEIGELDPEIQVKLLRVLQSRTFQRLGEVESRQFRGKIIAATNRDLAHEIAAGRFRSDFYYRLCADLIRTPTLKEQIEDRPEELESLVRFISRRVAGEEEADGLTEEVMVVIRDSLGADYPWPGNVRELEQCIRNVLIRNEYRPQGLPASDAGTGLAGELEGGHLTADQLLSRYCTMVYKKTGSYVETARRLGLDRRTVKSKVDEAGARPADPEE